MLAIGSNPAIITPAPNAIPATGADTPAPLSNGNTATPTKLAAEPTTSRSPITHISTLSARGFHFATTCLPPFFDRWLKFDLCVRGGRSGATYRLIARI